MKKILFITNLPTPYRVDFYNELGKYTDLTVIFEGKRSKELTFNWNEDTITNFKPVYFNEKLDENKIYLQVLKYLSEKKFNTIVVCTYYTRTQILALLYLKSRRIPYYFETDGGIIPDNEKWFIKLGKNFLISGAKKYFSPSSGADEYLRYYGANVIVRYPFTSLYATNIVLKPLGKSKKKVLKDSLNILENKVVLSVGQFIHRKGFDVLLESLKFVDKSVGVYIIGGKPIPLYQEIVNKLGLTNVHFIEFKSKSALADYFLSADLFVLPTREDIWGLVINEAMGYGLPVITTNKCVAGVELVKDKEIIVPVEDAFALGNAINIILNNEEFASKLSLNNLESIRQRTFENMVEAHINNF
jgi:glycosyltransferase involved in cell wall biosynthesis